MAAKKKRAKPGPDPSRLKLEGDWQQAIATALGKKRPDAGWPKPDGKTRKKLPTRTRRRSPA